MGRRKRSAGVALLAGAVLAGTGVFGGNAMAATPDGKAATKAPVKASAPQAAKDKAGARPAAAHSSRAAMLLDSITPSSGSTVGVAMPISVVFSNPVAPSARANIERHLKVTTSVPVTGAWHWFGDRRVDFRPQKFWPSGTRVTLNANLTGVGDGYGRYGVHGYQHTFTIGADVEATISVPGHTMRVYRNGKLVRTMPIDAGSPQFPSWDGTMAVIDKQAKVRMTSCSVGITCDPHNPNYYDITLPWDVHLTFSGTYVHYSTADPHPGHANGSHGCVHLSLADSEWFYNYAKQGDPVTITGSPRGKAAGDNGYADYDLSWSQWLAGSATGATTA
ncbi:L,D-transpeptidase [Streptomyces sp. RPT161]|uniref:L,D-transpeptidase n=1 Tax=Streptomyces sp. RPT161 TaxID=3015993 RepID=UPI0022B92DC7|nr:L,D-transpeptidase [Streptomyces sp. RPT161]